MHEDFTAEGCYALRENVEFSTCLMKTNLIKHAGEDKFRNTLPEVFFMNEIMI